MAILNNNKVAMAKSVWTVSALANCPFLFVPDRINRRDQHEQMQGTGPCRRLAVERVRQTALPQHSELDLQSLVMPMAICNGVHTVLTIVTTEQYYREYSVYSVLCNYTLSLFYTLLLTSRDSGLAQSGKSGPLWGGNL